MVDFNINLNKIDSVSSEIKNKINTKIKPVFMCVGSDKYVADSLGPIVGEMLKKKYNINAYVYGSLDYNINAKNLNLCYNYIRTIHPRSQVIVIDATLGEDVGNIKITDGVYAGMGNIIPTQKFGDLSVLGVVGKAGKDFRLNSVKMQLIVEMSKIISEALYMCCSNL